MNNKKLRLKGLLLIMVALFTNQINAQKIKKEMKLNSIDCEMVVDATPQQAWDILASYGDVADYHAILDSSKSLNGSPNQAEMGCERECIIPQGRRKIMVRERIIDFKDGEYYTYDVYDWENFPLKKMLNTFGVKTNAKGQTVIYQHTDFRLKPRFLTWIMKGKLRSGARESLMAYKHYIETGEKRTPIKLLKKQYKTL